MVTEKTIVSVTGCATYDQDAVRQAVQAVLTPLGGLKRFVQPGMRVLLKPNLLSDARWEQAITTHPIVLQTVAEMVSELGGVVWIGDSPGGPIAENPQVYRQTGTAQVAAQVGGELLTFEGVTWKQVDGRSYYIARPVLEADLVINLPKLKPHMLTLYTGAVKNLFGVIPGQRKRELHMRAPGVIDFSAVLVDVLELARPGLTLMDGILGQEGQGPGASGTPHWYRCLAASTDPVALDTVMAQAMGYRPGQVIHLAQAGQRGLGVSDPTQIEVAGDPSVLAFGQLHLPHTHWYLSMPSWLSAPVQRMVKIRPDLNAAQCIGCGRCSDICPGNAITPGKPPIFDFSKCVGCLCCVEICPRHALSLHQSRVARWLGVGR